MSWAAVAGAAISVGGAILSKPKAPKTAEAATVDLQKQQKNAIAGNLANQNDIESLTTQANNYSQKSAIDLMNQAVPGYSDFAANISKFGQDKLAHPYDLPDDVTANLNRISAERGISRGTAGQTNQYSALRDLGVNMLDYGNQSFQQAITALSAVTGTAPRISPMSPMSFYVTPAQSAQVASGNAQNIQNTQQASYNAQASASNFANQNLWDSISKGSGQVIGAWANRPPTAQPTPDVSYDSGAVGKPNH